MTKNGPLEAMISKYRVSICFEYKKSTEHQIKLNFKHAWNSSEALAWIFVNHGLCDNKTSP